MRKFLLFLISLPLTACITRPIDHSPALSPLEQIEPKLGGGDINIPKHWWRQLGDPQLELLVNEALKHSPNMALAKLRVEAAQQQVNAELATMGPKITGNAQLNEQRLSKNYIYLPNMPATTSYGLAGASLNWSLDIWDKQKKTLEAIKQDVKSQDYDLEFTKLWLAFTVVQAYIDYDIAFQHNQIASEGLATQKQLSFIAKERFKAGLVDHNLVDQLQIELEKAIMAELKTEQIIKMQQHQLAALVNQGPSWGEALEAPQIHDELRPLPELIPASLIARRSDLQALLTQINGAKLRVDVAKLSYLPDVNLQSLIGFQAFNLGHLLESNSRQFSLGPVLSLPIFDSSAIASSISSRQIERNQLIYSYQNTLLSILKESANGILAVNTSAQNLTQASQAECQAASLYAVTQQKRLAGLVDDTTLLQAQLQYLMNKQQLLDAQDQHMHDYVSLLMSLGGPIETEVTH
jgi:NodT family efflux transporter outer membrane factor (OMF) lipoprotein